MPRRLHVRQLTGGRVALDPAEAHHARDVLRLTVGADVELFDDAGQFARGSIERCDTSEVSVRIERVHAREKSGEIIVASAVPKGERADWMIEKLSELGVDRFVPLQTARSVVIPSGKNKHQRWMRIATESAKQSRRAGIMQIDELTSLADALQSGSLVHLMYLSTANDARPLSELVASEISDLKSQITLLIGPEGGWTDVEIAHFARLNLTPARLTETILRVETAAIAAAAIVAAWRAGRSDRNSRISETS